MSDTHIVRGKKKNTINVSTNSNIFFCGIYGCSNLSLSSYRWVLGKWMSKNPNFTSNNDDVDNNDIRMRMMTIILMMKHCEGAAA